MISSTEIVLSIIFLCVLICSIATIVLTINYRTTRMVNKKDTLEDFRKWYHCCKFCKHMSTSGAHNVDVENRYVHSCYCLHPDAVKMFTKIDTVDEYFFCGKWESHESFNTELFKFHSQKCLESPLRAVKNKKW